MHVFYASRDGQARRIAERIAVRLGDRGIVATAHDLAVSSPSPSAIADSPVAILVAAVRYGRHLQPALGFLATYSRISSPPPLVLASVNLTARKPGKDTPEGNPYLRKLIARQRLTPALATAFAGRLDYPEYGLLDREIIRLIMRLTGGPTDPTARVEYTSWPAVDAFAAQIAELCDARAGADLG